MRSAQQIREMLFQRLNSILWRPGMWIICEADLELQLRSLIYDLYFIDEIEIQNDPIREQLIAEGLYYPSNVASGVSNIFKNIMPDAHNFKDEICSVYARKAYQAGYLDTKSILPAQEFNYLVERIISGEFSQGFDQEKLLKIIPPPSFQTGKTLCYAPEELEAGWIYFDFPGIYTEGIGYQYFLRSIRWPATTFEEGFELTKEGYAQTQRGIAQPQFDGDTFIKEWKDGRKWSPGESLPSVDDEPRKSRWQHLW